MKDLIEDTKCEFEKSTPTVAYRETITQDSTKCALSKSDNKHNRVYVEATPLSDELIEAIESNRINPQQDAKTRPYARH